MKGRSKTLLWQANIILIGIKFYTVQKCSMQSDARDQRLTGVQHSSAPACVDRAPHPKPSPLRKVSIPSGVEYPHNFVKTVCNPRNRHPGVHAVSQLHSITRLTSSATLLQLLASIISISSISWETQRIILSLSVLLSAGLNDRKNNSNRMTEHGTLKSQGMKPVNEKST